MEGINADTKLETLTDAQRLELAEKLKAESTSAQPLISSVEPIEVLSQEYANNEAFLGKIEWLKNEAGFIGIRRAKGDGDCFYRAFAFAFIYKIMMMKDRPMHHFTVKHVESTLQLLKQAGFDQDVYTDFYEPLKNLLNRMYSTDPETKELNEHALVQAMNDPEQSNSIVVYLRLLTSAFLKLNEDEYTPFLFSLDTATGLGNSHHAGPPTMADFCANQVEPVGKEADHVQITALSRALKVSLDVAYLSPSQAPPETPIDEEFPDEVRSQTTSSENSTSNDRGGSIDVPGKDAHKRRLVEQHPHRCDVVRFEVEGGQITEIGTMLLRPGHYDLLVQAPEPASPEPEIPPVLTS